jgi:hypothetical protein
MYILPEIATESTTDHPAVATESGTDLAAIAVGSTTKNPCNSNSLYTYHSLLLQQ